MNEQDKCVVYEFGHFRADALKRQLLFGGVPLALTSKAFDTLIMLIRNHGETVLRNELIDAVWADTAVEENNLTQQISTLRRTLGERASEHRFIVTLPGRGYSFVAPVQELTIDREEELVVMNSTCSSITVDISKTLPSKFGWRAYSNPSSLFGSALALSYVLIVCLAAFWPLVSPVGSQGLPQTVVILPFRTAAGEDESLSNGIRDTLRARLGNLEDVRVRPERTEIGTDDALYAGQKMQVDVVFSGSVQSFEGRVRVAVEMIDVKNERIVWGQTFDYNRSNRFELQDAIAGEVVRVLRLSS